MLIHLLGFETILVTLDVYHHLEYDMLICMVLIAWIPNPMVDKA